MTLGFPSVTASPAAASARGRSARGAAVGARCGGAVHIFQAIQSR